MIGFIFVFNIYYDLGYDWDDDEDSDYWSPGGADTKIDNILSSKIARPEPNRNVLRKRHFNKCYLKNRHYENIML